MMMTSISTKQFTEIEFKCWLITISGMAEGDWLKNVLRYFIMFWSQENTNKFIFQIKYYIKYLNINKIESINIKELKRKYKIKTQNRILYSWGSLEKQKKWNAHTNIHRERKKNRFTIKNWLICLGKLRTPKTFSQ